MCAVRAPLFLAPPLERLQKTSLFRSKLTSGDFITHEISGLLSSSRLVATNPDFNCREQGNVRIEDRGGGLVPASRY
jgi:hypothetical protein